LTDPRIVIVGSNHEYAPVAIREQLAFSGDALAEGLRTLGTRVEEGLILSTCNRTEIYAVGHGDHDPKIEILEFLTGFHSVSSHLIEQSSYVHSGTDAVNHLFRVASGLDSLVLGEPQILSQIRDALATAREAEAMGPVLQRLTTDALRVGKRARTETDIARNRVSIAHAAVDLAIHDLGHLEHQSIVLLGAGKMATLTGKLLKANGVRNLTIINRSFRRAQELAGAVGGVALPATAIEQAISHADLVIGAVMVDEPMLRPASIRPRTKPLLMIDISVPRSIDQACTQLDGVHVRDVDALEIVAAEVRRQYADEVAKVEGIVDAAVTDFESWSRSRAAARAIERYQARSDNIQDVEIERTLRKLSHLSDRDQNLVRALAKSIARKLTHDPIMALREATSPDEIDEIMRIQGIDRT
jgi:glutamyl-tRNA reductase